MHSSFKPTKTPRHAEREEEPPPRSGQSAHSQQATSHGLLPCLSILSAGQVVVPLFLGTCCVLHAPRRPRLQLTARTHSPAPLLTPQPPAALLPLNNVATRGRWPTSPQGGMAADPYRAQADRLRLLGRQSAPDKVRPMRRGGGEGEVDKFVLVVCASRVFGGRHRLCACMRVLLAAAAPPRSGDSERASPGSQHICAARV